MHVHPTEPPSHAPRPKLRPRYGAADALSRAWQRSRPRALPSNPRTMERAGKSPVRRISSPLTTPKLASGAFSRSMRCKGRQANLNAAAKLSRTCAALLEGLDRHRGKGQPQVVRVERVTVEAGGRAIVGAVSQQGGGGDQESVG